MNEEMRTRDKRLQESFEEYISGSLEESELKHLDENVVSDAFSFLKSAKDKIVEWYKRYGHDKSHQEKEYDRMRTELAKKGIMLPEDGGPGFVRPPTSYFQKFRDWLNRIGTSILQKILGYLRYLVEPSLGREEGTLTPMIFDVLLLGASVIAFSMGLYALAGVFLGAKVGMKGFRDVVMRVTADEYYPEAQEKSREKIIEEVLRD